VIAYPPGFQPETDDMLMPFFVNREHPGGTPGNKSNILANVTLPEKVLPFPQMLAVKRSHKNILFGMR
jgi:hypothetical protein